MKCKNCGGEIRLEDMYCPYCGSPNLEAQRHARDMQKYRQEFQKTREDVTERATRQSRRAIRIAAIALLLVAIGVNIFLQANSFGISSMLQENRLRRNLDTYKQELAACLEKEDYPAFAALYSARRIYALDNALMDQYYPVYRVASNYRYAEQQIMKLINHSRYSGMDHITKYASEYIQEFYESLDPDNYTYYESVLDPATAQHFENMTESMEALLTAYLDLTPEEARSMRTLSRGNRVVLIEKGLSKYEEEKKDE